MADTHVIVLPGGGYATHARNEAEPIVEWLSGLGLRPAFSATRSMFLTRCPSARCAPRFGVVARMGLTASV
jgi:hypothetical protein